MPVVASATLEITPVMSGAQQSITQQLTGAAVPAAEKTGQQSGSKFSSSLVKGIAAGSAAVAGAVAGVSGALIKTAGDTAAYGDRRQGKPETWRQFHVLSGMGSGIATFRNEHGQDVGDF